MCTQTKQERINIMAKTNVKLGFYKDTVYDYLYLVSKNTDAKWVKDDPRAKFIFEEWKPTSRKNVYEATGKIMPVGIIRLESFEYIGNIKHDISGKNGKDLRLYPNVAKKSLKETAIYYEIGHNLDDFLDTLLELGFLPHRDDFEDTTESDAYCWLENNPSKKDIDKVLTELGYEI